MGETPVEAVNREALEEAGVVGKVTPTFLVNYRYPSTLMGETVAAYLMPVDGT